MTTGTAELVRLVTTCPDCGHRYLRPIFDGQDTNFRCRRCGACWGTSGEGIERIQPLDCGRCRFRPLCLAFRGYDPLRAA